VHAESWRTSYAGILSAEVVASGTASRTERGWRHRLARTSGPSAVFAAEADGRLVGFASCGPGRDPLWPLEGEVYALYLLRDYQRRGLGRALLSECARHFVRQGVFGFYLWVLKANRARLFYEAVGGEAVAEKEETLGGHAFGEIAFAWRDLTLLVEQAPNSSLRA
jgi:ribosomal protein S18 acetylase RimI-like enzyme